METFQEKSSQNQKLYFVIFTIEKPHLRAMKNWKNEGKKEKYFRNIKFLLMELEVKQFSSFSILYMFFTSVK